MKAADAVRLKNAIDLARAQVQDLADNGFDPSRLASCLQRLDSVVLTATELKAPTALLAALGECVKSCAALAHRPPSSAHVPALPMIRILLSAPDYVDFLAAGNADCPPAWSDLINDSRRQRGESPLFNAAAEPVNPYASIPSMPPLKKMSGDAEVVSVYRNIKPLLRQCVKLEFTAPTRESANGVHLLLSKLSEITSSGPIRNLFWVVSLLNGAVASGAVPRTPAVLRASLRASATLSRLSRSGLKSKSDASAAVAVRRVMDVPFFTRDADLFDATFCLRAGTVEDAEEVRHVRDVLRGVSGKTIGDFRAALVDALAAPLAASSASATESVVALKRAAAALHVIGLRRESAALETLVLDQAAADPSVWGVRARDACQNVLNELDDRRRRFASVRSWLPGQAPSTTKTNPSIRVLHVPAIKSDTPALLDQPPVASKNISDDIHEDIHELASHAATPRETPAPPIFFVEPAHVEPAPPVNPTLIAAPAWDFELIDVVPDEPVLPMLDFAPSVSSDAQIPSSSPDAQPPQSVFSHALDDDLSWTPPPAPESEAPDLEPSALEASSPSEPLPPILDDADPTPIRLGADIPSDLRLLSDDLLTALTLWARDPHPDRLDAFRLSARSFLDGSRKHVHHQAQAQDAPPTGSWSPPKAPPKPEPPVGLLGKIKAMMATDRK